MFARRAFALITLVFCGGAYADWQCPDDLNTSMPTLEAGELNLCDTVKNAKAVLVVNTASMCGFTPQFEGLEALYQKYKDRGLVIMGVPTADFGGQEYDSAAKTSEVCHANYGVTFPMFRKSCIRCDNPHPLLALVSDASGSKPKWNFYKYVLNPKDGSATAFSSLTKPGSDSIDEALRPLLAGE
ncbi:glutathione peroxidase [Spongiibacter nanhainus]|uniref:Glutathione peroxidase n=1 Tax=Spongiibacter nanhainus TaxID=2794344 RepID=A0A7T4R3C0_9GAMM|nr:glutathione peroxidase [Spongiibacter nanhainus]QQD19696.1 glutathione peroxidase [Spongiibacter nanhainus]